MGITLVESSILETADLKRKELLRLLAVNSDILSVLPFENIHGRALSYTQEVSGKSCTEHFRLAGGELDADELLVLEGDSASRDTIEVLKVKAMALHIAGVVINGDREVNVREFDGLKKHIVGKNVIPADSNNPQSNSPLSVASLDYAIEQADGPTHLIMSKAMRSRLSQGKRDEDLPDFDFRFELDEFGTQMAVYKNLPILVADYDDTGSRIINFNEAGPGGDTTSTSIYVVSIGPKGFTGLQNDEIGISDLGRVKTFHIFRTRVEWLMGIAIFNSLAAIRIWGITDAPLTK